MNARKVDLLLLNASNYPGQPIYPYAFVQVSAIARQHGLTVRRYDFLGTARSDWPDLIRHLVTSCNPRMIGFHVRQVDNQIISDYKTEDGSNGDAYYPLTDTKFLLEIVRHVSDAPIVIGGFAISVHGQRICDYLQPDYAIYGGPDSFFDHFDELAERNISSPFTVANLIWKEGFVFNNGPQEYFPPLASGEYDNDIFSDMCAFYSKHGRQLSFGRLGEVDVPVEIMRGCPCHCYFCTEPHVKGRRAQKRDLDAVMEDVAFLAERDIRSVWFICSEINMFGMALPLEIAARMERLNTNLGTRRILWKAYAMPRPGMTYNDIRYLMSTGYVPGWNEFTSFDDDNLKACGMPYRASHVVRYLKDIMELSRDRSVYHGPPLRKFEMFLGNAHMTTRSIRTTLAVVDQEGFGAAHDFGGVMSATRVYEIDGKLSCGTLESCFSISPEGVLPEVNTLFPTFYQAPELLAVLGSSERVTEFLSFVGSTFLSRNYRLSLDVLGFLPSVISLKRFAEHLCKHALPGLVASLHVAALRSENAAEDGIRGTGSFGIAVSRKMEEIWNDPSEKHICSLYEPASGPYSVRLRTLESVLDILFKLNATAFDPILEYLGLQDQADRQSPYRIMRQLYGRFESNESLFTSVSQSFDLVDSLNFLNLKHFLFLNNVRIERDYRSLLFDYATSLQ